MAIALLLAGCFSAAPEADPNSAGSADGGAADAPQADSAAGAGAVAPQEGTATGPSSQPEAAPRNVPIEFDGSLPAFVAVCAWSAAIGQCARSPGEFNNRHLIEAAGPILSGTVELTWEPSTRLTAELSFSLHSVDGDGQFVEEHGNAYGASPLRLEIVQGFAIAPGSQLRLGVGAPAYGAFHEGNGALAQAAAEQSYRISGWLLEAPAADAEKEAASGD